PEQARAKPVDRRADIWAFGCVLFEMLTGRQAFPGESITDIVSAITRDEPAWSTLPPETPPQILALLRRCLQKDPQKRLPHIGVARLEIEEALSAPSPVSAGRPTTDARLSTTDHRPPTRSGLPWAVAALALVLAGVLLTLWAPWRPTPGRK